jgi:subtilisin family serine protease
MAKASVFRQRSAPSGAPAATRQSIAPSYVEGVRYARASLIIPRVQIEELDECTFAPAAFGRSSAASRLAMRQSPKSAAASLLRVGMKDLQKVQAGRSPASENGVFTQLGSLGMATAFFGNEQVEANAINELADAYDFVPSFDFTIPIRQSMSGVAETRGSAALAAREWPQDSGVSQAHERGIRGAGVVMGVLDTGVDADHAEFTGQTITYRYVSFFPNSPYWPPRDVRGFDPDGHGTHVCGIVAGTSVGVAPECKLYVASVIESETTRTSLIRVASGLNWILRQFTRPDNEHLPGVLNMSLGFPSVRPTDVPQAEYDLRIKAIRMLLKTIVQANVVPLVAIGNDGAGQFGVPGAFREVAGVGAADFSGKVAPFSGGGRVTAESPAVNKPDFVGYGVGIYSSVERDYEGRSNYQRFSGTSMATPYASGIAALFRCREPQLTVAQVIDRIKQNAVPLNEPAIRQGAGLVRFI